MAEPKKARLEDEAGQQNGAEEGGDDGDAPEYDEKLLKDIEKLQEVQDELERVNEEASDKVLEVEQKYNEVRRPVYNRRNDIIAGISDFWLTAFLSHPALSQVLSEDDQKVFKYLKELNVEDFKDVKSGYTISFTFKANPFFKDERLSKTFRFSEDGLVTVTGTKPRWNEGMDLVNGGSVKDEQGRKRARSEDSFFRWFNDSDATYDPSQDQDQIAEVIKDELWPNPLKYFNSDQYDEDDDEEDEGEEDLEEELEELEEEEEEEGEEGEEGEEEEEEGGEEEEGEEEEEEEGGQGEEEEEGGEGEEEGAEEGDEEEGGEEGEGDEEGNEEGGEEDEGEDEEGE